MSNFYWYGIIWTYDKKFSKSRDNTLIQKIFKVNLVFSKCDYGSRILDKFEEEYIVGSLDSSESLSRNENSFVILPPEMIVDTTDGIDVKI